MGFIKLANSWVKTHKKTAIIIFVAVFILFVVSIKLVNFKTETNRVWWLWDDCFYINVANNLLEGNGYNLSILEYHQAVYKNSEGKIEYKYEMWDEPGRPYYFGGVVYPTFLAGVLWITDAQPSNYIVIGATASMILSLLLLVVVYFLTKRVFNKKIAILSIVVLLFLSPFFWFSMRTVPYILYSLLVMIIMLLAIRAKNKKDWLLIGVIVGLAHLTHSSGIVLVPTMLVWCLIQKKYTNSVILLIAYVLVLSPWLIRNHLLFNDASLGLGLPISNVLALFGVHYGMYADGASGSIFNISHNVLSVFNSTLWEFNNIYKSTLVTVVIIGFAIVGYVAYKNKNLIKPIILLFVFTLLGYVYLASATTSVEIKYFLPSLILLVPLAVYGVEVLAKYFVNFKLWYVGLLLFLIGISIASYASFIIGINRNFNEPMALKPVEAEFNNWVCEQNIGKDDVVLSNAPHVLYLGTGLRTIYFYSQNVNYDMVRKIIDKYNVKYIALYEYDHYPQYDKDKLDLMASETNSEILFNNGADIFYKVNN